VSCCIYKVNVASGNEGYISWTRCSGRLGVSQYLTVRDGGLIFNGIVGTVTTPPGATLLCIGDGGGVFPTTTTTTSTTTTSTTSTTTTLAVLSATVTSICNAGSGEITVSGMSGGTGGGYYWNLAPANVVPRGNNSTATGLSDGTYNVYLYDGGGNSRLFTVININCATTTTTSTTSTTTTTTLALDCTYSGGSAVIVYPATTTTTSTTTTTTTTTTTAAPTTTTTTAAPTTTTTTAAPTTTTTAAPTTTTTTTTAAPTTTTTTTTGAPSATLQWDFEEMGGADGSMVLYVNGSVIETRYITSNGTYAVYEGDTINVEVSCNTCFSPNNCSTAESQSNKSVLVASDTVNSGAASIFTSVYTVVGGDIGNNINLSTFAICNSTCL
jgi:hypothetical protein